MNVTTCSGTFLLGSSRGMKVTCAVHAPTHHELETRRQEALRPPDASKADKTCLSCLCFSPEFNTGQTMRYRELLGTGIVRLRSCPPLPTPQPTVPLTPHFKTQAR